MRFSSFGPTYGLNVRLARLDLIFFRAFWQFKISFYTVS